MATATTSLAERSKQSLFRSLNAAKSQLANIREAAEEGLMRLTIGVAAPATGAGTGYLHGWAKKNGKKITFGNTKFTYSAAGGIAATLLGAFGKRVVGEGIANVALGIGTGNLSAEAAILTYEMAQEP